MKCPFCGSERIEAGISWGLTAQAGNVGLRFKAFGPIEGVTQVYSDLCLDCGSIVHSYIKDNTDKKWSKSPGSLGTK